MIKKLTLAIALFLASFGLSTAYAAESRPNVIIHNSPYCGCCAAYADLMREAGYKVTVRNTEEVAEITAAAGIPEEYQGCHLTQLGGYSLSGHVPLSVVERLLNEKPAAKAYSLPGMPMGSPGMGGTKERPFTIISFQDGKPKLYTKE